MTEDLGAIVNKLTLPEGETVALVHPELANAIYKGLRLIVQDKPTITTEGVHIRIMEGKYRVSDVPELDSINPFSIDNQGDRIENQNVHLGQMYYGHFGETSYVEMIMQRGKPKLVGIVHFPQKIIPLVEILTDEKEFKEFYKDFFSESQGERWRGYIWDPRAHPSVLTDEKVIGLGFVRKNYYWKLEKTPSDIFGDENRNLDSQVKSVEEEIRTFIKRMDDYIARRLERLTGRPFEITPETARLHYQNMQSGQQKMFPLE